VEIRVARMLNPGSKDLGFEFKSYPITLSLHVQCISTGLSKAEWCVDYIKDPLGSFKV
jgi:hypothetical protein